MATDQFLRQSIAIYPRLLLQGIVPPGLTDWALVKGSLILSMVATGSLGFLSGFFASGQSMSMCRDWKR